MIENMRRWRMLGAAAGAVVLAVVLWFAWVFYGPNTFPGGAEKTFYVSRGQPFSAIVDSLVAHGIIRDKGLFSFVVKARGGTVELQVGKYLFQSGVSNNEVYTALKTGRGAMLISVTLPEGFTVRRQARVLSRVLGIDSARYVTLAMDPEYVGTLGISAPTLEGFLYPETYLFTWQPEEKDVIRRLIEQFQRFYTDSLRARADEMRLSTLEVLTMASIVEGESRLQDERPVIAGVYYNRLRRGMRLQADPTIQYILEKGPRRVMYSDLVISSPYNTYRNKGLPPGPVNNPGKASILAALYPVSHSFLYFVANGRGGHWFTTTYDEHMRYVRIARRQRALSAAR